MTSLPKPTPRPKVRKPLKSRPKGIAPMRTRICPSCGGAKANATAARCRPCYKALPHQVDRFMEFVEKDASGCWLWRGSLTTEGYGALWVRGHFLAHRWSYRLAYGYLPSGLTLDHLCRVRHCVNPAHLEAVSIRTNLMRGIGPAAMNARRTRCIRGHVFDTLSFEKGRPRPKRGCRACNRAKAVRYRARVRMSYAAS